CCPSRAKPPMTVRSTCLPCPMEDRRPGHVRIRSACTLASTPRPIDCRSVDIPNAPRTRFITRRASETSGLDLPDSTNWTIDLVPPIASELVEPPAVGSRLVPALRKKLGTKSNRPQSYAGFVE